MSATTSGQREEAVRATVSELTHATTRIETTDDDESDDGGGVNKTCYQVLPTGHPANRVAVFGTLTNVDIIEKNGQPDTYRAHVADETGGIDVYVGQYAPDVRSRLEGMTTPEHVMLVGKANYFTRDDNGEDQFVIEPEEIIPVEKGARERWTAEAVSHTLDRIEEYDDGNAPLADLADDHYDADVAEIKAQVEEMGKELIERNTSE